MGLVEAKVKYILWPLSRFGPVPSTPPDTSFLGRIMPAPKEVKDINELMRAQKRASRVKVGELRMWSISRPGVAMTTSGRVRRLASCAFTERPPERKWPSLVNNPLFPERIADTRTYD